MKILITGTDGFIGSNLLKKLKNENNHILTINENIFNNEEWQKKLISVIEDYYPDVVYHVGACSNTLEKNVQYIMTVNFEFTKILCDYCYNFKIPLIYSSSAANYGSNGKIPTNLYAWSKYVSECYVNSKNGISLRYFNVYGPGEQNKGEMASLIYKSMIHKEKSVEIFKLFPKKPKRDFIYIDDVLDANIFAYNNFEKLKGRYYDVGYGVPETFEKILDIVKLNYLYVDENLIPFGYQFYTCSDEKKWMPGWSPKYNLKKGIKKYIKFLKNND